MVHGIQNEIRAEMDKPFSAEVSHCESAASDFLVSLKRIQHKPHAHGSTECR